MLRKQLNKIYHRKNELENQARFLTLTIYSAIVMVLNSSPTVSIVFPIPFGSFIVIFGSPNWARISDSCIPPAVLGVKPWEYYSISIEVCDLAIT